MEQIIMAFSANQYRYEAYIQLDRVKQETRLLSQAINRAMPQSIRVSN